MARFWAFRAVGCVALLMIPLAFCLRAPRTAPAPSALDGPSAVPGLPRSPAGAGGERLLAITMQRTVSVGFQSSSFVLLVAGFFACGFHVVFVNTHLAAHCKDVLGEAKGECRDEARTDIASHPALL